MLEHAAKHPHCIDQQTTVSRIVAPALADTAIHPQTVTAGQVVLLSES